MKKQLLLCALTIFLGIFLPIITLGLIQFLLLIILGLTIDKFNLSFMAVCFIAIGMFISFIIIVENKYFNNQK